MRPITLTVAGLHSFREKQTVHFDELAAGGVFGIFGPTGSGKSTLLDAMTLALFGKVERAANNTQGIMNHGEDRLAVSFTFELGGKLRYRVERSYKRKDDISLQSEMSRAIEIGSEEKVLADKERDVTQTIKDLLGLTNDDFTRAVVLPQGKFAEFLSLKGKERRQMLQRLFHLERYGDRLQEKLKKRTDDAQNQVNAITAEQQGLGDASKQALDQVKAEYKAAKQAAEQSRVRLQEAEKQYQQAKQIWDAQQEKVKVKDQLKQLDEQQGIITQYEQRLQQAREADRLMPYITELEQAREEYNTRQRQAETTEQALKTAQSEANETKQAYEKAKNERTEQEPKLSVREAELKQAQKMQEDLKQARDERDGAQKQLTEVKQQQQSVKKQLDQDEAEYEKWLNSQQDFKQQLNEQAVSHEHREQVRHANEAARTIENTRQSYTETKQDYDRRQSELAEAESTLQKQEDSYKQDLDALGRLFIKTSAKYNEVCEMERQSERALSAIDRAIKQQEQERETAREQELAQSLVGHLQEGEPCPVCGSIHHPAPADVVIQSQNDTAELETLKQAKDRGEALSHETSKLKWQLEQLSDQLSEWLGDVPSDVTHHETATSLEEDEDSGDPAALIHRLEVDGKSYRQDLLALEEESKTRLQEIRELDKQRHESTTLVNAAKQNVSDLAGKLEKIQNHLNQQEAEWKQNFPNFALATIRQKQQTIDEAERKTTQLRERIDNSIPIIEKKAKDIESQKNEGQKLELRITEQQTRVNSQQEQVCKQEKQLRDQIGEGDATQLLDETTRMISALKQAEETQYAAWQNADTTRQQKDNAAASARESFRQAGQRIQTKQASCEEQLVDTSFDKIADAKQASATKDEQKQWQTEIEAFYDRQKRLKNEKERLNQVIGEREITEESWQQTQNNYQDAKQQNDEAVEQRGNAKQKLDDIEDKHDRFNQLEQQRKEVATLLARLQKLRKVFSGNSFVEFVAEEQLMQVARDASARLGNLTRQRYAIEVDSAGGFIMRDNANGGVRRPVTTLSGGETFLTSLALALSLSSQIQLRGQYPLEFFFLDEGFGTLDQELLDTVVTALEQLHVEHLSVGVISHVPELRARLPVRLIVDPPQPSGIGSRTHIERL